MAHVMSVGTVVTVVESRNVNLWERISSHCQGKLNVRNLVGRFIPKTLKIRITNFISTNKRTVLYTSI